VAIVLHHMPQMIIRARGVAAAVLSALCLTVGVSSAAASSMTFTFTDDSSVTGGAGTPPYGTVVVSTISGSTTMVDVLVTLASGNKFVSTGGGHEALTWNIAGDPAISISGLPSGFVVGPAPDGVPGLGTFDYSIDCPGCGPGASHAKSGPLDFQVSLASGLTPNSFNTANGSGYTFSADIISGQTGKTGSVASLGGVSGSSVPEPLTLCLLGSGLGMLCARRRK
jgi:hypothetical protein